MESSDGCVSVRYAVCPCVSPLGPAIDDAMSHVAPVSVPSTLATRRWRVPGKESLAVFLYLAWLPKTRPLSFSALKNNYPWDSTEVSWFFGCILALCQYCNLLCCRSHGSTISRPRTFFHCSS